MLWGTSYTYVYGTYIYIIKKNSTGIQGSYMYVIPIKANNYDNYNNDNVAMHIFGLKKYIRASACQEFLMEHDETNIEQSHLTSTIYTC